MRHCQQDFFLKMQISTTSDFLVTGAKGYLVVLVPTQETFSSVTCLTLKSLGCNATAVQSINCALKRSKSSLIIIPIDFGLYWTVFRGIVQL